MERIYSQIKVTTKVKYGGYDEKEAFYAHSYKITIQNHSLNVFQLLRRHWAISDGLDFQRIVQGEGVVGEQPIIKPGKSYSYSSWCSFPGTVGYMKGEFYCLDLELNEEFTLDVPMMTMVANERMN